MREYIVDVYAMKYDDLFGGFETDYMSAPIIEHRYPDKQQAAYDFALLKEFPRELYHTSKACGGKPVGYVAFLECVQDEDISGYLDVETIDSASYTTDDYMLEHN